MATVNLPAVSSTLPLTNSSATATKATSSEVQKSFSSFLKESINNVNKAQNESDVLTNKLAKGEDVDLSQVMITSQKASVMMSATLEFRNKAVEAYQEMMRMSI